MRRFKAQNQAAITHWFCQRCENVFNTEMLYNHKQCECGHWMIHVTENELAYIRKHKSF